MNFFGNLLQFAEYYARSMAALWQKNLGLAEGDFEKIAEKISRIDLKLFFDQALRTTKDLDWSSYLNKIGIQWEYAEAGIFRKWGFRLKTHSSQLTLKTVYQSSLASKMGLMVNDELIAINGYRLNKENVDKWLQSYVQGDRIELLYQRHHKIKYIKGIVTYEHHLQVKLSWQSNLISEQSKLQQI